VYVNTSTSGVFRITTDVNHENWITETARDGYLEGNIYPYISKIYAIAAKVSSNIESEVLGFRPPFIPYDDVETYPNVGFDTNVLNRLLLLNGIYYTMNTLGGSNTSLTSQTVY
jgi:hypothetical protein